MMNSLLIKKFSIGSNSSIVTPKHFIGGVELGFDKGVKFFEYLKHFKLFSHQVYASGPSMIINECDKPSFLIKSFHLGRAPYIAVD